MIKAIIFDFGSPIVEWEENMNAVYRKHEDHKSLERDTIRKFFNECITHSMAGEFRDLTDYYNKNKPDINITIEELNEVMHEAQLAMYVRPEMIEYIEELKKKYQIALLSNFGDGLERLLQEIFKIYHLFDIVISSYNLKIKKPDPRIYQHALDKLGIQPEEAVFIDDLEENIKGAEAVGIKSIVFRSSEQCKSDLAKLLS